MSKKMIGLSFLLLFVLILTDFFFKTFNIQSIFQYKVGIIMALVTLAGVPYFFGQEKRNLSDLGIAESEDNKRIGKSAHPYLNCSKYRRRIIKKLKNAA